jgi:uncharacterized protein
MTDVALITGASAGLGSGFAIKLAESGRDLLLVARRKDRLAALAERIVLNHKVRVFTFAEDLAAPGAADRIKTFCAEKDLDVTTLINNAGCGFRGRFVEIDGKAQAAMVQLNCSALMELCHVFLPAMIARKSGGILNIASTAAFQPGPYMSSYYASKAFVLSFSEGLHEEMREHGVKVACLCPGPTKTEFADLADLKNTHLFTKFAGRPNAVVRDGLAALDANVAVKVSGLLNTALAQSIRTTPRVLARRLAMFLQKGALR